jgi:hypothetical protein
MNETIANISDKIHLLPTAGGVITSAFCYYVAVWGIKQEKASRPDRTVPQWLDSITPPLYALAGGVIGTFGGYLLSFSL